MAGKVLDLDKILSEDQLGSIISLYWLDWDMRRQSKRVQWDELRQYVYATDTRQTSNSKLPWKNTTTIPKLCQIRDNLFANYMATMFPKRKWLQWEAYDKDSNTRAKSEAIVNYMSYVIDQDNYKKEVAKLVLDYIDYGNCFSMVEWQDDTQIVKDKTKVGYVGPTLKRISPLDIVFNPIAPTFEKSPKIIRSLVSMGEVKEMLERLSTDQTKEEYEALWKYMQDIRGSAQNFMGYAEKSKNDYYRVDGFTSYQAYLTSGYAELLTFYGDIYDREKDEFLKNHVVVVVDRHKVIHKAPNPSYFGYPPIFHCGWRVRQDNLWAMGPLDNLVGMQYRIDHIENLKADVWDLITFPPLKIKGYVEDFEWGPMERIYVGDDGDVQMLVPPFQVLEANQEIKQIEAKMEEMAGAPKEAMGFRTPGEKTMYEVQRLENASSRIYTNKIAQLEETIIERSLNAALELARRIGTPDSIKVMDDEFKIATFKSLSPDDITGNGKIKPVAARHFAEKAEVVQNLNQFFSSAVGKDPSVIQHFSSVETAKLFEDLLEITDYEIVQPYIRLSEQADGQRLANAHQQAVQMEAGTPAGISPDDHDEDIVQHRVAQAQQGAQQGAQGAPQAPQSPQATPVASNTLGGR